MKALQQIIYSCTVAAAFVDSLRYCENQPDGEEMVRLLTTPKECLEVPDILSDSCKACEKQPDGGEMARLLATLEGCLETLCILPDTQGRSPAAPVAAGVSRGGQGAATVRYHCVNAECLGILDILE